MHKRLCDQFVSFEQPLAFDRLEHACYTGLRSLVNGVPTVSFPVSRDVLQGYRVLLISFVFTLGSSCGVPRLTQESAPTICPEVALSQFRPTLVAVTSSYEMGKALVLSFLHSKDALPFRALR